jgi:peptidoglycan/LPS O-acetylase OafA/YrhL
MAMNRIEGARDARVSALAGGVGVSLLVMAALHLTHVISGGGPPYDPSSAGVAEAVIGAVLLAAVYRARRSPEGSWGLMMGALAFAIAGFVIGMTFTVRSGTAVDVAYHAVGLPLLLITLALHLKRGRE